MNSTQYWYYNDYVQQHTVCTCRHAFELHTYSVMAASFWMTPQYHSFYFQYWYGSGSIIATPELRGKENT